jgi:hypothetical protein
MGDMDLRSWTIGTIVTTLVITALIIAAMFS